MVERDKDGLMRCEKCTVKFYSKKDHRICLDCARMELQHHWEYIKALAIQTLLREYE